MKSFVAAVLTGLAFVAGSTIPAVAEQRLECSFVTRAGELGWMPQTVYLTFSPGQQSVIVLDEIIQSEFGEPLAGNITAENAKRISFSWLFKSKSIHNDPVTISYRLTFIRATGKAELLGTLHGYSNQYHNSGRCNAA